MSHATASDTIAAVATARGAGGIGIVRLSGAAATSIAHALTGKRLRARHAHAVAFRDADGAAIDHGLALAFPAPHSFTGEDVVELHAHGSPVVLDLLLRRVLALGARAARAGEFSERAFLNGKLDLAQAEAIADLIASGSEAAARAATRSLEGEFSRRVRALAGALTALRAWLEAALDFPDEDVDFLAAPQLAARLGQVRASNRELLAAARRGVRLADGLHVVIVGRPNVGKSSLLNALARSDRAIVTDLPGTTRDLLRETLDLDGIALTLVDTAGLREAGDVVEREGIRRAQAELDRADLVLFVSDGGDPAADDALLAGLDARLPRLVVRNKIDLRDASVPQAQAGAESDVLRVSARSGEGLDALRAELTRRAGHDAASDGSFSARRRHVAALERVVAHLDDAADQLQVHHAGELAAEALRQAQLALGEITGEVTSDDLLGTIFASFCIGK